jgi:hypothetical protein
MADLRTQIHTYVESTIERVDSDDVVVAVATQSSASGQAQRKLRPVWVAAGAAALVSLLVGVPLLFVGSGDPVVVLEPSTTVAPVVTTVPATTVAPVATTVPSVAPATPMTWERIEDAAVFGSSEEQRMTDAATAGEVVVAVLRDNLWGPLHCLLEYCLGLT